MRGFVPWGIRVVISCEDANEDLKINGGAAALPASKGHNFAEPDRKKIPVWSAYRHA